MFEYEDLYEQLSIKPDSDLLIYKEENFYYIKQTVSFYVHNTRLNSFNVYMSKADLSEIYHIAAEEIDVLAKRFNFTLLEKTFENSYDSNNDFYRQEEKIFWPVFVNSADCQSFIKYIGSLNAFNDPAD